MPFFRHGEEGSLSPETRSLSFTKESTSRRQIKIKSRTKRGNRAGKRLKKKKRTLGENVVNLSGIELTTEQLAVLDKGLKHAPVRNLNKFETYIGIQKYIRKIYIKKYILNNPFQKQNVSIEPSTKPVHSALQNNLVYNPQVSDQVNILMSIKD